MTDRNERDALARRCEGAELLQEAYDLLAEFQCFLRHTARQVTRGKVLDWLDRAASLKARNDG